MRLLYQHRLTPMCYTLMCNLLITNVLQLLIGGCGLLTICYNVLQRVTARSRWRCLINNLRLSCDGTTERLFQIHVHQPPAGFTRWRWFCFNFRNKGKLNQLNAAALHYYVWQKPHACHRYQDCDTLVTDTQQITCWWFSTTTQWRWFLLSSTNYFYYLPKKTNQNRINDKLFALCCVRDLALVPKHTDHTFSLFQRTQTSRNTLWYLCQFDFVMKYLGTRRAHSFEEFWFGFSFFSQFVPFFNSAADISPIGSKNGHRQKRRGAEGSGRCDHITVRKTAGKPSPG